MWLPIIGLLLGISIGFVFSLSIPTEYSRYTAMAILAALIWILLMLPYEAIHRAGAVPFPTLRILGRFFRSL